MPRRSAQDELEAAFRDLRGAIHAADGHTALAALERGPAIDTLQYSGDGVLLALARGVASAVELAAREVRALRDRIVDGDEDLCAEIEAAFTASPARP